MLFVATVTLIAERSKEAFDDLKKLKPPPGVIIRSIYALFGKYDLLIIYEAQDERASLDLIFHIRRIGGVMDTETHLATDLEELEEAEKRR